jgi:Uri superfamily endonuclease
LRPKEVGKGGAYLLILQVSREKTIDVGALGPTFFPKGKYAYSGSALTSLEARVGRHFSTKKKVHWHIDHLMAEARPLEALVLRSKDDVECMLNEMVGSMEGASPIAPGFGCSDCGCSTHLHHLDGHCLSHLEDFFPERLKPSQRK